jgi:hypothetical protein
MNFKSGETSRNLPELMDDYFRLYARAYVELLQEDRKATGVSGFIGRDNPSALLTSEVSRGYASRAFEDKSRRLLEPLVDATMALQKSCSITRGQDEPVSVSAKRVGDEIAIQVTVSDRLGGIHARRVGQCAPAEIDAFFLYPPELVLTVGSEDSSVLEALKAAPRSVLTTQSAQPSTMGRSSTATGSRTARSRAWMPGSAPRQDGDPAVFANFMAHFRRLTAESSHKPLLIMAPASNYDEVAAKFDRNVVEPLELDVESLQYRP